MTLHTYKNIYIRTDTYTYTHTHTHILYCMCIKFSLHIYILLYYMGVVQDYGTPKLPLRRPFANLSRPFAPFRAPAESGQGIMITFSCSYFQIKIYRRIVLKTRKWKHSPKLFYRLPCPTTETQVEKTLKGFCSGNIARQTRPFWAKVGSWHTRLSPTFREPFADFSPINMFFFFTHVSWEDGRVLVQWLYECNCN